MKKQKNIALTAMVSLPLYALSTFFISYFSYRKVPSYTLYLGLLCCVVIAIFLTRKGACRNYILSGASFALALIKFNWYAINSSDIMNYSLYSSALIPLSFLFESFVWTSIAIFALANAVPTLESQKPISRGARIISFISVVVLTISLILLVVAALVLIIGYSTNLYIGIKYHFPVWESVCDIAHRLLLLSAIFTVKLSIIPPVKKEKKPRRVQIIEKSSSNRVAICDENFTPIGKHICLLLFTFGIWQMIWIYKTTKYSNLGKDGEEGTPATALLLCLFVPFYLIYWTYKTAQRIDSIANKKGLQSDISTVCLVLAIFVGIVPPILMQDKINQSVQAGDAAAAPQDGEPDGIELLYKYKALLDEGIITQEEFDAKKKQLLGL